MNMNSNPKPSTITTKKTYLLLPDIIKQAKEKQQRQNKQNLGVYSQAYNNLHPNSNPKIAVSKYLETSLKPKQLERQKMGDEIEGKKVDESNISLRSNFLFDEDQFIKDELETLKLKEEIRKCDTQLSLGRNRLGSSNNTVNVNMTLKEKSKQKQKEKSHLVSRKSSYETKPHPKHPTDSKSQQKSKSRQKSKLKASRNLLKQIKANKKQTIHTVNSTIQNRDILKDFDSSSRQEIEPVLNFLEQLKNSDKLIFDPEKFQRFLDGIKGNKEFHKALRTFVYSYFIQNELND